MMFKYATHLLSSNLTNAVKRRLQSRLLVDMSGFNANLMEAVSREGESKIAKLCIKDALHYEPSDQRYRISGWVKLVRKKKHTLFVDVNDGSTPQRLQVVISDQLLNEVKADLQYGCSVSCVGKLVKSIGPKQPLEMICESIRVGKSDPELYPFGQHRTIKFAKNTLEGHYIREQLHFRARLKLFSSLMRIRSEMINAIHIFMKQNNFINITTPIITSNDCEGGGQVFTIKSPYCNENETYFQKEIYLTVSGQFHLEAMACALSRVYTLNSSFRAEKSSSKKHLSEFIMFEAEESFIESIDDIMDRVESICKFIIYYLRIQCCDDLNIVHEHTKYEHLDKIANNKYIRLTYNEAIDILIKSGKYPNTEMGQDFNNTQEKILVEHFDNNPVFITHFPANLKPFYMKQINGQALCFDLLSPVCGETCGGSIREDNYDELEGRIKELNSYENLKWYLDLRQFGAALHGGFGIGFDRFVQTITGMKNIKDVTPFPRWHEHCLL